MNKAWLQKWIPLLTGVVGGQLLVQGLNAVSGLLIVRLLPRETAYAWFTVASSMIATLSLLSDAGTGVAANALGGPVWQDRVKFSQVIAAVMRYRRWLVGIAAVVVLPWSVGLLLQVKAPGWGIAAAATLISLSAWPATSAQILGAVNRLHSRYKPQILADVVSALVRLLLTVLSLSPLIWLYGWQGVHSSGNEYWAVCSFIAIVAAACLPNVLYLFLVKREAYKVLDAKVAETREFDAEIRKKIRSIYPSSLFLCISSQLSTWFLGLFGTSAQVADIGALGRLAVIFSVASAPITQVACPAFSRCAEKRQLKSQFIKVGGMYLAFALLILACAWLLPQPMLWVLGPQYSHLVTELRWFTLSLLVGGMTSIAWGLVMAKGWVGMTWVSIPLGLFSQTLGAFLFPIGTVIGVIQFNMFATLASLALAAVIIWTSFKHWDLPVVTEASIKPADTPQVI